MGQYIGKIKAIAAQHSQAHEAKVVMHSDLPKDIDESMTKLLRMLTYTRPAGSKAEAAFIAKYIDTVPGMQSDEYGNRYIRIGEDISDVMFSCHTDTVHQHSGWQSVCVDEEWVVRTKMNSPSNCLGADDCAGVWLCLELISMRIAGLYVFHRAEERGGLGSSWIADNAPAMLDGIKYCIAFDRKARTSIITHQSMSRTASDEFADSLADVLDLGMVCDTTGSFTDSMTYAQAGLIAECTNLSVGYDNEHTSAECLSIHTLFSLRNAFATNWDEGKLVCMRDPNSFGTDSAWAYEWEGDEYVGIGFTAEGDMLDVIDEYPEAVAALLKDYGITVDEILEYTNSMYKNRA